MRHIQHVWNRYYTSQRGAQSVEKRPSIREYLAVCALKRKERAISNFRNRFSALGFRGSSNKEPRRLVELDAVGLRHSRQKIGEYISNKKRRKGKHFRGINRTKKIWLQQDGTSELFKKFLMNFAV